MTRTILILLCLAFAACGRAPEQSISFQDSYIQSETVRKLKEEGVEFREKENAIWYSTKDAHQVLHINRQVISSRPVRFQFENSQKRDNFTRLLMDAKIHFDALPHEGDGYLVLVPAEHQEPAQRIFQLVLHQD